MKRITLICLIIILTSIISLSITYAPNDKIWIAYDVYNEPLEKIIEIHPNWVFRVLNIWGNTLDDGRQYSQDAGRFIKILSENNIKSSAMIGGISISSKDKKDFIEASAARNPLGKITGVDNKTLHGCYNRIEWRQRLETLFDIAVKSGVSAIELDQPSQEHWRGECYCNTCNEGFTKWLIKNNIKDIDKDFDYVAFLKKNNMAHINEGDREIVSPYGKLYWKYQIEKDRKNIGRITDEFNKRHKGLKFFGNTWGLAGEYIPAVPYYSNIDIAGDMRTPWIWEPDKDRFGAPFNSWIPVVKLARAIDNSKSILSFLDTYPYERILEKEHDRKDDVLAQFASEIIASGAEFVFPYSNRVAYRDISGFDHERMKDFIRFLKDKKELFGKRKSESPILLIVDEDEAVLKRFMKQYWAIAYLIIDNSLDFDVVFRKDLVNTDITSYKKIIDCKKYSEDIFRYCYDKNENYIKEVKKKISDIKSPYSFDGDKYTRVFRAKDKNKLIDYIVPTDIDNKKSMKIYFNETDKDLEVSTFPDSIKVKKDLKDGKRILELDTKPFLIILKKTLENK
ncbi:MAG: hypothetical protein C0601_09770 [Candidatus Muiribacterium halophilum]|uniref:Beta-galactosidase trimerisation domain-containing protein n=1 Tax=Muiribacterium halophilum TaxID=2053465 RepID=A0A2N5ZDM0_MUIH1|nr:MAG: hypothetical protein C0601_09770 [Candidatus Muirbacterium halophilum]